MDARIKDILILMRSAFPTSCNRAPKGRINAPSQYKGPYNSTYYIITTTETVT